MWVTAEDAALGFGPSYSEVGEDGRLVATGNAIPFDQQGRQASRFAGVGQIQQMTEEGSPIGINPWPEHSVYRDSMRGLGAITRFKQAPRWGAAVVDLDRRPVAMKGLGALGRSGGMGGFMDTVKAYLLPIGLGAAAAVALAVWLRSRKRK